MKFTDKALVIGGGTGATTPPINIDPKDRQEEESLEFSLGEQLIAGQFKYNAVVSGSRKIADYLAAGLHNEDVDPNYNPYDNPEYLAGYPKDLFIDSKSRRHTDFIKTQYDRDRYLQRVSEEGGAMGVAAAIGGGVMNPLYMIPYLQIGQRMRYAKSLADAAIGEALTEGTYHAADLDMTRTTGESIFNIMAGAMIGGVLTGAARKNAFTKGELKEIKAKLKAEMEFVGPVMPESAVISDPKFFEALKQKLGEDIEVVRGLSSQRDPGVKITGQLDRKTGRIKLSRDPHVWQKAWDEKAWTNPRELSDNLGVNGISKASPLPENQFTTFEEFVEFVAQHEKAHKKIQRLEGETRGAYEDRVNQAAIKNMKGAMERGNTIISSLKDVPGVDQITGVVSRTMAKLTPLRVLTSPSENARKLGALLGEQSVKGTSRQAVETAVKMYDGYLAQSIIDLNSAYKKYHRRTTMGSGRMSRGAFNEEVAKAMRRGDEHPVAEVQEAARKIRREIMQPVRMKAKEVGVYLSDEDVAKFAKSYFPRMYNFDKINANRSKFKADLTNWLQKEMPDLDPLDAKLAAEEISRKITHEFDTHHALANHAVFTASALKGRKVPIPDEILEPWLISDPALVLRAWSHNMATEIELTRMFGGTEIDDFLREVEDEWDELITKASEENPTQAAKLNRRKNDDIAVLKALHSRLLNRYALPENRTAGMIRLSKAARNLNVLRLLGGMTLSAFPDLARPLYHHHFSTYAKAIKHMVFADDAIKKMLYQDARRMGIAQDMVLHQRLVAMTEVDYLPNLGKNSLIDRMEYKLEKGVTGSTGGVLSFGHLSLMSPWNANAKMMTFLMSQDGLIAHINQPVKFAKKLRQAGISDDMARRIKAQYDQFGEKVGGDLRVGHSDKWTDLEAADLFEATLMREVDGTIITPGIMDKPLWMSTEPGKVILQFKSFGFAATNKQFISGLQNQDAMIYQGMLAAIALGAMTWSIKRRLAGYDDQDMSDAELLMRGY
jgi:hypothetical protein